MTGFLVRNILVVTLSLILISCGGSSESPPDTKDSDGDGVVDVQDAFPLDSTESVDTDNDGISNNADTDDEIVMKTLYPRW